jgi:heme O synthase-like polyprenyltransferase
VLPVLVGPDTVSGHLIVARAWSVWTGFTPEWGLTPLLAVIVASLLAIVWLTSPWQRSRRRRRNARARIATRRVLRGDDQRNGRR